MGCALLQLLFLSCFHPFINSICSKRAFLLSSMKKESSHRPTMEIRDIQYSPEQQNQIIINVFQPDGDQAILSKALNRRQCVRSFSKGGR